MKLRRLASILIVSICGAHATAQTTWHVNAVAPSNGDGLSWWTAFDNLDDALLAAGLGDTIWVARGTYKPKVARVPGDPRSVTFDVGPGLSLFGGFDGTESALEGRAGLFDQTVLSGDIGMPGVFEDNAYQPLYVHFDAGIPPGTVTLDGFTITGGNANAAGHSTGGGILIWNLLVSISNCTITRNFAIAGGGIHAQPGGVLMKWCSVTDNQAITGGALWVHAINLKISHSEFARNRAVGRGGAIFVHSIGDSQYGALPRVYVQDSVFHDNAAEFGGAAFFGGGLYSSGKGTFTNCTFAYNRASSAGGALHAVTETAVAAETEAYNSIFWDNDAARGSQIEGRARVQYSIVMGGHPGAGNLVLDPLFVNQAARNLRLSPGSPAIDSGDVERMWTDLLDVDGDGVTCEAVPRDLDGQRRFADDFVTPDTGYGKTPIVDMGPYEH